MTTKWRATISLNLGYGETLTYEHEVDASTEDEAVSMIEAGFCSMFDQRVTDVAEVKDDE